MRKVTVRAPVRADLAGGTLDLWPLYLFHPGSRTVNVALRSEEHTSELQSQSNLVCRLLLEKKRSNRLLASGHDAVHLRRNHVRHRFNVRLVARMNAV